MRSQTHCPSSATGPRHWLCAPSFVHHALQALGHTAPPLPHIARRLSTTVDPADENPWNLPTEPCYQLRGTHTSTVVAELPALLAEQDGDLSFRHISFHCIACELYPEVLAQASVRGCIVGVGYAWDILNATTAARPRAVSDHSRHVSRLEPLSEQRVRVIDNGPPCEVFSWDLVTDAVLAVDDGFWVIGPSARLHALQHTLPWPHADALTNDDHSSPRLRSASD